MSLKDNWKEAGKGIGKTVVGAGKALVNTAKVGIDKVQGDTPEDDAEKAAEMKESWSEFGHSFLKTGASLGKAAASTAEKVVDELKKDDKPED